MARQVLNPDATSRVYAQSSAEWLPWGGPGKGRDSQSCMHYTDDAGQVAGGRVKYRAYCDIPKTVGATGALPVNGTEVPGVPDSDVEMPVPSASDLDSVGAAME